VVAVDIDDDVPEASTRDRQGPSRAAFILALVACMFFASAATYWWDHRPPSVGAVDVGFFDDMTTHHLQAISMAETYLRYGTDDLFRGDAAKIIFSQSGDVRQMQRALTEWHRSGSPDVAMEWMGMHSPQDAQPGMATPQQLAALNRSRGRELDDLFSALMINHHRGGIHMADYAKDHAKTNLARTLARIMARDQRFEIIDLNGWREHLGLPYHRPGDPVPVPTA
jgi:uncharacterized protein (DUF305 family)